MFNQTVLFRSLVSISRSYPLPTIYLSYALSATHQQSKHLVAKQYNYNHFINTKMMVMLQPLDYSIVYL